MTLRYRVRETRPAGAGVQVARESLQYVSRKRTDWSEDMTNFLQRYAPMLDAGEERDNDCPCVYAYLRRSAVGGSAGNHCSSGIRDHRMSPKPKAIGSNARISTSRSITKHL